MTPKQLRDAANGPWEAPRVIRGLAKPTNSVMCACCKEAEATKRTADDVELCYECWEFIWADPLPDAMPQPIPGVNFGCD